MHRFSILLIVLLISAFQTFGQVSVRDTLLTWKHFDYTLDDNGGMQWYSTTKIVEEEYPGLVIENEYVRLVVLPEFGARIISFYYKPSGHEQFYTNPIGNPYGMGDGNFYFDWLMVFGGVFPTFPEPEHGKTWFLPWQWEITENTDERVSIRMELQDTINYPGHPGKFNNGVTEMRCISTVSLVKGKTSFELHQSIQNTKSSGIPFEYWTCTTLAPGSEVGNTFTPRNAEIIAPIDYVFLKDDWWSWMGQAETPAPSEGSHVFHYENLAIYDNWEDMGIAYAHPMITANYYGVINHENEEGVFRVANNSEITPGMKFWTWGADQGLSANPENFYDAARPYIELWSGISTQFFENAYFAPNETISWTETYLPTLSMSSVDEVNENGAIHLKHTDDGTEIFIVKVFATLPDSALELSMRLEGNNTVNLNDKGFISNSEAANKLTYNISDYQIDNGDYDLVAKVFDNSGNLLIESSIPVTIPFQTDGIPGIDQTAPQIVQMSNNVYKLVFKEPGIRTLSVISINGQLIDQKQISDQSAFIKIDQPGMYVIRLMENGRAHSFKIVIG